jgi:hypothetical protein
LLPGRLQGVSNGNPVVHVTETGRRLMVLGNDRGRELRWSW